MAYDELEPDEENWSIIMRGDFNPAILQPYWFFANDLVNESEAKDAELEIVHKNLVAFKFKKARIKVHADTDRLALVSEIQTPALRDIAAGILNILEHTPLRALGFNRDAIYTMESEKSWNDLGNTLVPKERWGKLFDSPGLQQVTVQGTRDNCDADLIIAKFGPTGTSCGVSVAINQHYQLDESNEHDNFGKLSRAMRAIISEWSPFQTYAREAATKLICDC